MANWNAYRAIKTEAERVGWPTNYKSDLTEHDRKMLSRKDAPEEFVWMLRENGTHLLPPNRALGTLLWAWAVLKRKAAKVYVYHNEELTISTHQDALNWLIKYYVGMNVHSKRGGILGQFRGLTQDGRIIVTDAPTYRERYYPSDRITLGG